MKFFPISFDTKMKSQPVAVVCCNIFNFPVQAGNGSSSQYSNAGVICGEDHTSENNYQTTRNSSYEQRKSQRNHSCI
jgi:hypothetical protein